MELLYSSITHAGKYWTGRVYYESDVLIPLFLNANDYKNFVLYILAKAHNHIDSVFFALVDSILARKHAFIELTLCYSLFIRNDSYAMIQSYCRNRFFSDVYPKELATVGACKRFCSYSGHAPDEAVTELFERLSLQSLKGKLQFFSKVHSQRKYI